MLLVTGGTGFVGKAVLNRIAQGGYPVRILLQAKDRNPNIPRGMPVDVALTSAADPGGVRAALVGIRTVIHLAGAASPGSLYAAQQADLEMTRNLAEAAAEAGVERLVYLSQLGADRGSAYQLLRVKAEGEDTIRSSGVPYTIIRSAALFGEHDNLTSGLAKLVSISPIFLPIPGDGSVLLQPLWVEDLATGILWMLDDAMTLNRTIEVGGAEFFSLRQLVEIVMRRIRKPRIIISVRPPYLRLLAWFSERLLPRPALTNPWLDYLAENRITALDSMPGSFGLQPARLEMNLDYLEKKRWSIELLAEQFGRRSA